MSDQFKLGRRGVERREQLLRDLRPLVQRRGQWRRLRVAVQAGAAAIVVVGGAVGLALSGRGGPAPVGPTPIAVYQGHVAADHERTPSPSNEPSIVIVQTTPGIAEAVAAHPQWDVGTATDAELASALRAVGNDGGVVRVSGRVIVSGDFNPAPAPALEGADSY